MENQIVSFAPPPLTTAMRNSIKPRNALVAIQANLKYQTEHIATLKTPEARQTYLRYYKSGGAEWEAHYLASLNGTTATNTVHQMGQPKPMARAAAKTAPAKTVTGATGAPPGGTTTTRSRRAKSNTAA